MSQKLSDEQLESLKNSTYKSTELFTLDGYETVCNVVKAYDGDSCHCVFFYNNKLCRFRVRLNGIDTAEKRSDDPLEVEHALKALNRFDELAGVDSSNNKLVYIKCYGMDMYGRLLADLYPNSVKEENDTTINQILLDENLAYPYDGKKKKKFREWYKN